LYLKVYAWPCLEHFLTLVTVLLFPRIRDLLPVWY